MEKLRYRCFADTQILSHVREKKYMLEGTEDEELQELRDSINDMDMTRSYMHDCNAKCEQLRKLHAKTSTNCGLLDKPELLRNYDDTKSEFKNAKESVQRLRTEIEDMNKKISNATGILRERRKDSRASLVEKSNGKNGKTLASATSKSNCILQSTLLIQ